jgi:hypothetical protein
MFTPPPPLFAITTFAIGFRIDRFRSCDGLNLTSRMMMVVPVRMLPGTFTEVNCPNENAKDDHCDGAQQKEQLFEAEAHPAPCAGYDFRWQNSLSKNRLK